MLFMLFVFTFNGRDAMTNKRPSKRERLAAASAGHSHSPPTNSKAIRKANIQAVLSQSKHIVWRSDAPGIINKAYEKAHSIKAFVPINGTGNGPVKPYIPPAATRKHAGDVPYIMEGERIDMRKERARPIVPERQYKKHKNKKGFRAFNKAGKA